MTAAESCELIVQLTHDVRATAVDRDAYRLLAATAIGELRKLTLQHDRLRARHQRLLDEYRAMRATHCGSEAA